MVLPKDILNNYEWLFRQVWFEGQLKELVEEGGFPNARKKVQRLE